MGRHVKFIARTIFVQDGKVEEAFKILNRAAQHVTTQHFIQVSTYRILGYEGIFDIYRRTRYYEKPYLVRRRVNFEICKAIYNEDMSRKIAFTLRTNRVHPWPGYY